MDRPRGVANCLMQSGLGHVKSLLQGSANPFWRLAWVDAPMVGAFVDGWDSVGGVLHFGGCLGAMARFHVDNRHQIVFCCCCEIVF